MIGDVTARAELFFSPGFFVPHASARSGFIAKNTPVGTCRSQIS